ncbi:MAG: methylmalonyl-CoA mutase [Deltaproteobacteria bacterium]|nr:methylmalonyl-CoA mutase [Deltaproteobacteria bacterium]
MLKKMIVLRHKLRCLRLNVNKKKFETTSHIEVKELYTREDVEGESGKNRIETSGAFPFTRGIYPSMYRKKLWTMRQYAGFATAEESNKRYRYLFDHGQTGLSVAFDLPTQMGFDSDSPKAFAEVGRSGVAIDSLQDMEILLKNLPLDRISTSMTINATAATLLACYIVVGEKQGVDTKKLQGTIQNDILKEYIARGTYIYPPEPSLRLVCNIFSWCQKNLPQWNTISISGYHIREAGSSAVQELAFTLANAITYVEQALKSGLNIDDFAGRLSFFFNGHNNFLEEVAKFRAARRMWANIMKNRFGAKLQRSWMLRFHTQTGGSTLMANQIENNVVRVTLQALAAVLGGTQSLHTNSKDEALSLPSDSAAKLALRTQQVIAYESGVADFVDPLGGSYAVESLTNEIEKKALDYISFIEKRGGVVACIEEGFLQSEIQKESYAYQQSIENKEQFVVGVNIFQENEKKLSKVQKIDERSIKKQISKLQTLRKKRNSKLVRESLSRLEQAAKTASENLFPYILEAVRGYATVGEISNTLRNVFGEYKPSF